MKATFEDITSRVQESPSWHDMNGTPRYGKFIPKNCPDIYAEEIALIEIGCQSCQKMFQVEMHWSHMNSGIGGLPIPRLSENPAFVHYGDPPNHGCVGDTMNCLDYKILEFYKPLPIEQITGENWGDFLRCPDLEISLLDRA